MPLAYCLLPLGFVDRSPVSDTEDTQVTVPLFSCSPVPPNLPSLQDPYQTYSFEKVRKVKVCAMESMELFGNDLVFFKYFMDSDILSSQDFKGGHYQRVLSFLCWIWNVILNCFEELYSNYSFQYGDTEISGESDNEEPNQQTVDKYLCSRRHTVGPGDTHHEEVRTHPDCHYPEFGGGWLTVKCITIITFHQPVMLLKESISRLF